MGTIFGLRRDHLKERLRQSMAQLGRRYQGILYEILDTAGVPEEYRKDSQIKVWQLAQAQVRRNPLPWRVPSLLWCSCISLSSREDLLPERLRRKLMLRAFIEEIPDSAKRSDLLRLAYQDQGEAFQALGTDERALENLAETYIMLHKQLLRNADRLVDWSDGAFLPGAIAAMAPPYSDFEEWLFEMDNTSRGSHAP